MENKRHTPQKSIRKRKRDEQKTINGRKTHCCLNGCQTEHRLILEGDARLVADKIDSTERNEQIRQMRRLMQKFKQRNEHQKKACVSVKGSVKL